MNPDPPKSISWFSRWTLTPTLMSEDPIAVRHSLIRLLAATERNSLDSRRAVELFAQEHWGVHRYRFRQILSATSEKTPLVDALEIHPRLLGDQAMLAIRLGQATGSLPAVWEELTQCERPIHTETTNVWRNGKAYWIAVAFALMSISLFIAWLILPKFKRLAAEFEFDKHSSSIELLRLEQLNQFIYLGILGAFVFAMSWVAWRILTLHPKSWLRRMASRISGEAGKTETGLWQLIAMNLASGITAKSTIEHLARLHEDNRIKRKLQIASCEITTGTEVWQSLVNAKLLHSRERDAIIASEQPDVQAWAMRHLVLRRRENLHFSSLRRKMWSQPIVTLLFGSFVLMIAYAVFSILSQMVLLMAESHG
jgi:type II secretory pathway component PulF